MESSPWGIAPWGEAPWLRGEAEKVAEVYYDLSTSMQDCLGENEEAPGRDERNLFTLILLMGHELGCGNLRRLLLNIEFQFGRLIE